MLTSPSNPRLSTICFLIAALFLTACASDSAPPPAEADSATAEESAAPADSESVATEATSPAEQAEAAPATEAPPAPAATVAKADLDAGRILYKKKCSTCHGANGEGNEKMAAMLKVTIRPLGSAEVQASNDSDIARNVTEGNGKMKPVTGLSDADLANVIAFLRTLAAP